ncbi:MAG: HYR domain-containing protein, partial [Saprospiraceae bacterium]|nr:HYR domain-containing protein [Saprospiraceae bacterium]
MMKIQLLLAFGLCSSLLSAQSILDVGIFNVPTDSSVLEIRIRPSETVVQGAYTAGVFTVRHLASYGANMTAPSVLNNPLYRYSLVNQGTDGAYKYYSFSFVSPSTVNWTSGQEYPIARVKVTSDCQQPNAVFEIINNAWTLANNGNVYQELNGLESQDSIYQPTVTTVLGGTMVDTIPPTLTCTTNKQVSCDTNQCSYTHSGIAWNAIGSDNCSGVTFTYFLSGATLDTLGTLDQALFQTGITDIMVVGADGAGLTDTCMFQVTVADTQSPTLTAPANITVSPNTATCSAGGVQLGNATASDNCPGVQVTSNAPAVFPSGQTVVIWTATDAAGLTTTATQTVLVQSGLSASGLQLSTVSACASDSVSVAFAIQGGTAP